MIDNLAKVYLNENGSIKDFEDTAFLVSNADKANSIQFYVPDSMNTSLVQLSFKRADGFVISNRQMELITVLDPASGADVEVLTKLYEYQFTESDRILDIAGQLQVSAVLKDGNQTVATPYFCLYVRKNIQPNLETKTEEEFYQEGLAIVEQAQIDINNHRADFNNPHRVRGDQVPLSNQNTTLITDKLSKIDESITENNTNITNLQQKDIELEQTIEQNKRDATSYTDSTANALEGEINLLNRTVEDLESNKLNKVFNDIAIANNLAENDYFVLNSGNQTYRITVENMKKVFGGGGGSDHYKGDFISYEELVETYPIAKAGDYAFVNIGSQMIMYVWDSTGEDETMQGLWRETTSGKYVLTTTFANFQEMLLNGSLIVDTAKHYDNGDGTKTNIKQTVDAFTTKILDLEQIIEPIFTNMDNNSAIGTITDEQWLIIKNNQNVKLKATIPISETSYVVAIAEKKNVLYNNGEINEIGFKSFLYGYIHLNIVVKPNLQVLVELKEYALAESLNIRTSDMNLIIGLSNEDSLIEKSIDLSPLIQTVVNENDVYIVNYDDVTTDSKVLNFLKNNQPEKIVVIDSNSTKKRYMCFVGTQQSTDFTDYKYQVILTKDDTLLINTNDPIIYTKYGVTIRLYNNGAISKLNGNYTFRYSLDTFTITYQGFTINPATDEEITTGTNDTKAITPKGLKTYMDGLSFGYVVPTVYITDASLEYGTFSGDDLTNLQNDPNTIIYQANEDSTNDAYTILGETAGTRTFGNFKGNIVYKIEVNLADGTWLKTNVDIVTQSEFNSTIGDINSILDTINGEVI
jgi:hypothetical protein